MRDADRANDFVDMLQHDKKFNKINLMRHIILLNQMLPGGDGDDGAHPPSWRRPRPT